MPIQKQQYEPESSFLFFNISFNRIAEFVEKTGSALSGMGSVNEGSSMTEGLPTIAELKQLHRDIARLEK